MAAFRDDMPLVEKVDEDWDEITTGTQIMRPDWDFSPIRMRTMHHLPHVFFDTLRPERQGAHGQGKTGKTGKMAKKNSLQGKVREFENFI